MGITKKFTKCTAHAEREVEVGGRGGAGGSNIIAGPPPQMSSSNDVRAAGTERKTRTIEWERDGGRVGRSTHSGCLLICSTCRK